MVKYVVIITSGLGNQILQYALYLFLKKKQNVFMYGWEKHLNEHSGLEINRIFDAEVKSNSVLLNIYINLCRKLSNLCAALYKRKINVKFILKLLPYYPIVFPNWDDYKIIKNVKKELIDTLLINIEGMNNISILNLIDKTASISIHIRRGDVVSNPKWRLTMGDICDLEYYQLAINEVNKRVKNPTFFVFSDDIQWAKQKLNLNNAYYIDWNKGHNSIQDILLMSKCKGNIICNSTFSYIGTMLNENNPLRIAPSKWQHNFNDKTKDIYIDDTFILIDNNSPCISLKFEKAISKYDIQSILNQSYTDFEVLLPTVDSAMKCLDSRVKCGSKSKGIYCFIIERSELHLFRNRKYLRHKLYNYLKTEVCKRNAT